MFEHPSFTSKRIHTNRLVLFLEPLSRSKSTPFDSTLLGEYTRLYEMVWSRVTWEPKRLRLYSDRVQEHEEAFESMLGRAYADECMNIAVVHLQNKRHDHASLVYTSRDADRFDQLLAHLTLAHLAEQSGAF